MGRCFDSLVEIVNKKSLIKSKFKQQHQYLEELLSKATLFDLPYNPNTDLLEHEKDLEISKTQLSEYFDFSKKYGKFLIMPFEITAIETLDSVVILENIKENEFIITRYKHNLPEPTLNLSIAKTAIGEIDNQGDMMLNLGYYYLAGNINSQRLNEYYGEVFAKEISNYINQLVFLMDPNNFIIKKQSIHSRKYEENSIKNKKKEKKERKTQMRPHYVCLPLDDASKFLKAKSDEPRLIHPVRGHKRSLISSFFKNKHGSIIYIPQHYRGQGVIEDTLGWRYEVILKKSPLELVEYSKL